MAETKKIKVEVKNLEIDLEEKDAALVLALQELTSSLNKIRVRL